MVLENVAALLSQKKETRGVFNHIEKEQGLYSVSLPAFQ